MCLPGVFEVLSVVGTVAGAMTQAAAAKQQGEASARAHEVQAAQYKAQSEMQARQAVIQQTTDQYQQRRKSEEAAALEGRQRAAYGATGLTIDGSPTDVMTDSASAAALDIAAIQWNSRLKASNLNYEAGISSMNASAETEAAKTSRKAGSIGAMSAMIGGVTKATQLGLKF